ncbi:Ig-like domain-containing protein [Dysgonomonas sp. 520]|uniref:GDSL-type esterase/lipase family protein n=1 Tax=Dysgonomonas sp. 520 TaxID=2302931 RepID=UPI0013D324B5|nr:Ig-like domain-containing protein [Dysgonomonas sp. 520]NDW10629.1 hypothetical protein [Dysgonomonas sp. 520]
MKKLFLFFSILFCIGSQAQTLEQKIYIDFGKNNFDDGEITLGPDINENYWNNAVETAAGSNLNLVNALNVSTGYSLEITKFFSSNGKRNGALLNPSADLLGDLAIVTATHDYFFVDNNRAGAFKIKNLDKNKAYRFNIFGSRSHDQNRTSIFSLSGANGSHSLHQTSDANLGGTGTHQNNSNIFTSDMIFPDKNGEIQFELSILTGGFAYINAMKIEEYNGIVVTAGDKFYIDFGKDNGTDGLKTESPDENGNYWNNMIATQSGATLNLITADNANSSYTLTLKGNYLSNGMKNGALLSPNRDLLSDFAIATATHDYFFVDNTANTLNSSIEFSKLNKNKYYRFYAFGSRQDSNDRIGLFTFAGTNSSVGPHKMGGNNLSVGVDANLDKNKNDSEIFVSDLIMPNEDGIITFKVSLLRGGFAHINTLKIEECDINISKATSISISGENITQPGQVIQMSASVLPQLAIYPDIIWSVDNEDIARIDSKGKVYPKINGTVQVTASIVYSNDEKISTTKSITISNQINELYTLENGQDVGDGLQMKNLKRADGAGAGVYEMYTTVTSGMTILFNADKNNTLKFGMGDTPGSLKLNGSPITVDFSGPALIRANLSDYTYEIIAINEVSVIGTVTSNGWDKEKGLNLEYKGNGVWSQTLNFENQGELHFIINKSVELKKIANENSVFYMSEAPSYGYTLQDITMKGGTFKVVLDLLNYTYYIDCDSKEELKISVMGSSVPSGTGASNNFGYIHMFGNLLEKRFDEQLGLNWKTSNISIGGNSTVDLLNRWERDLLSDCAPYVIYALSLGNEGIHDFGEERFIRYRDNMLHLIEKAREVSKVPVVTNNYTRGDFNATDYDFIKQMNLLIHKWDVPSVNLLGAIDNGAGRWATGYQNGGDAFHPNTDGHTELSYAIVPSLFDALEAGKPLPQRVEGTSYKFDPSVSKSKISFTPEATAHSFTYSFGIKTKATGNIASIQTNVASGTRYLTITEDGKLSYTAGNRTLISTSTTANNDEWLQITLTHYYAWGRTILYVNGQNVGGCNEKIVSKTFHLNDFETNGVSDFRELFFYRSGMNIEEITELAQGKMLKSSLEIYAPLDGSKGNEEGILENLAQSTNRLTLVTDTTSAIAPDTSDNRSEYYIYPNPSTNAISVGGLDAGKEYSCTVLASDGRRLLTRNLSKQDCEINISALASSLFLLEVTDKASSAKEVLTFIKK